MRVVWSRRALGHLRDIAAFVASDDPQAMLAETPALGRPGRVPGTRELVVTPTPYIVAYATTGDRVEVLAVLHGARRWPERL